MSSYFATDDFNVKCVCCERYILINSDKNLKCKVVGVSICCGAPTCVEHCCEAPNLVCKFCKKLTRGMEVKKKNFPFPHAFVPDALYSEWDEWVEYAKEYTILMRRPGFEEFVEYCQLRLRWYDHFRLEDLFHKYVKTQSSLQLASMFRMRMHMHMHMHLGQSNASVFGLACHKFTQMLALCRANGVRVIHPIKIHAHFGIAFLCVTRISTKLVVKQKSEDGSSVVVCSNTYWHTMIPWIIRWITRFPKQKR